MLLSGLLILTACSGSATTAPPTADPDQVAEIVNATLTAEAGQSQPEPTQPPPTEQAPPPPTETPTVDSIPAMPVEEDPALYLGEPDSIDTFDNATNWTSFNNECFANDIDDGKFVMDAKGVPGIACWTFTWPEIADMYLQTEVINPANCQADDSYGMIFRSPDNLKGFLFGLTCDGRIGLLNWDGQKATTIIPWTSDSNIVTGAGAVNRIGVTALGNDFQIFANGYFIAEAQNFDYLNPGKLGYYVFASSDQGFTVKYDNLSIWLLNDNYYVPGVPVSTPPPDAVPPPDPGVPAATTTTSVNVRSGPSTKFPIYFVAPPNTTFQVFGVSPDRKWWGVLVSQDIVDHGEAWISASYVVTNDEVANVPVVQPPAPPPEVKPPEPPPSNETVIATNFEPLNVRSGPGNQYPSYGVAPIGSSAEVLGVSPDGKWYVVAVPSDVASDGRGWVSASYVTLEPEGVDFPLVQPPEEPPTVSPTDPPPSNETVIATTTEVIAIYSGPGKSYESYGKAAAGVSAEALGRSSDGLWIALALPDITPDGTGWANANYIILEPANADLPVLEAP